MNSLVYIHKVINRHHSTHCHTELYQEDNFKSVSIYKDFFVTLNKILHFYHKCISRQHFLLIFSVKLSYIMVLSYHFGRGTKPSIYGRMEYVGLTVRSKRLLALLCTHVKSTLPCDVWMVLNVCTVKMIEINKIKELRLGPTFKKKKKNEPKHIS